MQTSAAVIKAKAVVRKAFIRVGHNKTITMADINISVDTTTDLFTITLDKWEWTDLYIKEGGNWVPVSPYNGPDPNVQFRYQQPPPAGPLSFKAVANSNLVIVNPANLLFMSGPTNNHTYFAGLSYTTNDNDVHMLGILETFDEALPDAKPSPLPFSQGRMTGTFQATS